jgi:DNA-binding GntR family transcriptional regulator
MGRVSKLTAQEGETEAELAPTGPSNGQLVRRLTSDLAAERIRRMIFDGTLRTGERVDLDHISAELGVSRLPVREAVRSLAQDGLLVFEPHAMPYVAEFDAEVLRDQFEIIGMVEGLAVGRVAVSKDPEVLARLGDLAQQIQNEEDPQLVRELGWEFQRTINRAGASARQKAVLRSLRRMVPSGLWRDVPGSADAERAGSELVWHAIMTGNRDAASQARAEIVRQRGEIIIALLRERGVFASDG